MVDFYTQHIPEYWYYSNFFPERHFDTSEEAIEFEKQLVLPNFSKMISFYERIPEQEAGAWTIKASDNYQDIEDCPGFKQIPFVYKTKKVFIDIQEDKISYYYFNEDTMQYELLETISDDGNNDNYIYDMFYSNPGISLIDEPYGFGPDKNYNKHPDYTLDIKDRFQLLDPVESRADNVIYYVKENKLYYRGDREGNADMLKLFDNISEEEEETEADKIKPYLKSIIINDDGVYCYTYEILNKKYTRVKTYKSIADSTEDGYYFLEQDDDQAKQFAGLYQKDSDSDTDTISRIKEEALIKISTSYEDFKNKSPIEEKKKYGDGKKIEITIQYYSSQENILYSYQTKQIDSDTSINKWFPLENGEQLLFIKQSSVTEGYLNLNFEEDKDKWYVRICRNVYSVFSTIWRGIVKIGEAIGTFFKNLWNWLKGQRYFGTEITFYWGEKIVEIPTKSVLPEDPEGYSTDTVFQSLETPKKIWYYDTEKDSQGNDNGWTKFNCERWETPFKTTGQYEHVVSRYKDLDSDDKKEDGNFYYVTQTQKIYVYNNPNWSQCPVISDKTIELIRAGTSDFKKMLYYCVQEKQCYRYDKNLGWIEDEEHSSLTGLYNYADAIRQVLNYKNHLMPSTAIKEFNSQLTTLNELMGFNFPSNDNTLQPQKEADQGDWGFYYYDKVRGWITGKEAYELEIL